MQCKTEINSNMASYARQNSKLQYSKMLIQDMWLQYSRCTAIHSIGSNSLASQINWNEDNKMQRKCYSRVYAGRNIYRSVHMDVTAGKTTLKCKKLICTQSIHGIDHFITLAQIHMKHGFITMELTTLQHDVDRKLLH